MDSAVLQMVHVNGTIMYVLAIYAFMALPVFMIQFYRSMMDEDSRLLRLLMTWLHSEHCWEARLMPICTGIRAR